MNRSPAVAKAAVWTYLDGKALSVQAAFARELIAREPLAALDHLLLWLTNCPDDKSHVYKLLQDEDERAEARKLNDVLRTAIERAEFPADVFPTLTLTHWWEEIHPADPTRKRSAQTEGLLVLKNGEQTLLEINAELHVDSVSYTVQYRRLRFVLHAFDDRTHQPAFARLFRCLWQSLGAAQQTDPPEWVYDLALTSNVFVFSRDDYTHEKRKRGAVEDADAGPASKRQRQ